MADASTILSELRPKLERERHSSVWRLLAHPLTARFVTLLRDAAFSSLAASHQRLGYPFEPPRARSFTPVTREPGPPGPGGRGRSVVF